MSKKKKLPVKVTQSKTAVMPGPSQVKPVTATKLPRINESDLEVLKKAQQDADLAGAEAQVKVGKMALMVARSLAALNMPIQTSAICLDCGTVRPRAMQICPGCSELKEKSV